MTDILYTVKEESSDQVADQVAGFYMTRVCMTVKAVTGTNRPLYKSL